MTTQLEENILKAFKDGDEKIFESIFSSYYNQIIGFCIQFVGDNDKAQSIAQEAFIKLWMNREKVEKYNGILSFLYTAAKTECLNFIRRKSVTSKYENRQLQLIEDELNREVLDRFDFNSIEISELEKLIYQSIEDLPEKCKLVFIKSRMEDKTNKEIAEELNISIKAVEANMTRALKFLRERLTDYLPAVLVQAILPYL
ncbi:MAG: RNA polymerase sigma-70 factor [Marinifilum sp.]|jgi:RNA polymerase sigma-70 factor (ECF subfamily)|nr:RNA polymerase sigma-70 factor [Marinifilum sp.]